MKSKSKIDHKENEILTFTLNHTLSKITTLEDKTTNELICYK